MQAVDDPVLGRCTVIPMRPSAQIWPFIFLAMGIAGPCILVAWISWIFGLADVNGQLLVLGFLCTILTPAIPSSLKELNRRYLVMVGLNGFATPSVGRILWAEVTDLGMTFDVLSRKAGPAQCAAFTSPPFELADSAGQLVRFARRNASTTLGFPLRGSVLPQEQFFSLFGEHVSAKDGADGPS